MTERIERPPEEWKHHFCPRCRKGWHWSQLVNKRWCPQCGYDVFFKWSKPTFEGMKKAITK